MAFPSILPQWQASIENQPHRALRQHPLHAERDGNGILPLLHALQSAASEKKATPPAKPRNQTSRMQSIAVTCPHWGIRWI